MQEITLPIRRKSPESLLFEASFEPSIMGVLEIGLKKGSKIRRRRRRTKFKKKIREMFIAWMVAEPVPGWRTHLRDLGST